MSVEVIDMQCPGCRAPVGFGKVRCEYCDRPVPITTFNTIAAMDLKDIMLKKSAYLKEQVDNSSNEAINTSLGMCLLKLNMYDQACANFEKVIENGTANSEVYFWNAVSMLQGKRPFLHPRQKIDKAIEYVNTAKMLEGRGIYSFFLAYLKYDYYELKRLNIIPNYIEELNDASNLVANVDLTILKEALKIDEFDEHLLI